MTFNGTTRDYFVVLRKRRLPWAPIENILIEVPGMAGAHDGGTKIKVRPLEITALIESKNLQDLQKLKEDLADWLVTDTAKELIVGDEPDRMYYAKIDGEAQIDEIISVGAGVIKFICFDPWKYSTSKSQMSVIEPVEPIVLTNGGTAPTPPLMTVTLKDRTTYLDIIGDKDYMRIGNPANIDEVPVVARELVLWDEMDSLNGWNKAQSTDIDGGEIAGDMVTSGYAFSQSNFGTGASWHGDARIKSLGQSLQDFEVNFRIELMNPDYKMSGRVELYLLDENKRAVGKLALKDHSTARDGNYAELRAGDLNTGHYILSERGGRIDAWTNFNGLLQLTKRGNKWKAHVGKLVNGKYGWRRNEYWTDELNEFTGNVAHIVVHFAAYGNRPPSPMKIIDLKVYKLNDTSPEEIEYIGEDGDVFIFDHRNEAIYRNGELFTRKDFGARFFPLYKGDNVLVVDPPEVVQSFDSEWRDAYK